MKLGFYGGSFNPPHCGHELIMNQCAKMFDKLLIIPNKVSPDKKNSIAISSKHRDNMLNLIKLKKNVEIDYFELYSDSEISYTYETIKYLLEKYSNYELTMIIGRDQLLNLKNWNKIDFIIDNVEIICFDRLNNLKNSIDKYNKIKIINFNFPYSSSFVRDALNNNEIIINKILSRNILDYINKYRLYQ